MQFGFGLALRADENLRKGYSSARPRAVVAKPADLAQTQSESFDWGVPQKVQGPQRLGRLYKLMEIESQTQPKESTASSSNSTIANLWP